MIPTVSVILPIYNAEKTINRTIEGFINQTYKNFEVICVDDGSNDNSLKILNELALQNHFLRIYSQKNFGPAKARNLAISQAKGKYIMFCDADDWYEPTMIEEMVNAMSNSNTDIVMCDCNVIDLANNTTHSQCDIEWCYLKHKGFLKLNSEIKNEINCVIWNKLFKKELLDKFNITYPTKYEHDDSVFFWKYIFASSTFWGIDKKLYNYVVGNPNSISSKYRLKKENPQQFDFIFSLQEIFDFIKSSNLDNDYRIYIKYALSIIKLYYKMLPQKAQKQAFKHIKNLTQKNLEFLKLYEEDFYFIHKIRRLRTFNNYVFNDIKEKESLFTDIFSIRKENCRKVITILGLKIKLKSKILELKQNLTELKKTQTDVFNQIWLLKKQLQTNSQKIDVLMEKTNIDNDTLKNSLDMIDQKHFFANEFHINLCQKFYKEMTEFNLAEKYTKLIQNLDNSSIKCISKILNRIVLVASNPQKYYDLFSQEEQSKIKKLQKEFIEEILELSPNCYAYQKYLLPIKHFEASVFYYKHQLESLKNPELFKDKDIIDVGGFIGDSGLILSSYTNKNIHSFEPITQNYKLMLKTIELNNCQNIIPVKKGLGATETSCKISIDMACSSINQPLQRAQGFEEITITTLDKYVSENNLDVGLIKVDTEGYEQEFLKGAKDTIKKFKPTLLISIYHNASDFFDIKPLIESWNLHYSFKVVRPIDGGIHCETLLIAEQLGEMENE